MATFKGLREPLPVPQIASVPTELEPRRRRRATTTPSSSCLRGADRWVDPRDAGPPIHAAWPVAGVGAVMGAADRCGTMNQATR
jgi:hypothetical protein